MSKVEKSPWQEYVWWVKVWFCTVIVSLLLGFTGMALDGDYTVKKSYDATLVNAFSTDRNCGHKGRYDCEVFMGRFDVAGREYDREIDGFFYYKFIEQAKQPLPAYITLSEQDMGVVRPWYVTQLMVGGFIFAFSVLFVGGLVLLLSAIDAEIAEERYQANKRKWPTSEEDYH